jgi:hypothetical protein
MVIVIKKSPDVGVAVINTLPDSYLFDVSCSSHGGEAELIEENKCTLFLMSKCFSQSHAILLAPTSCQKLNLFPNSAEDVL